MKIRVLAAATALCCSATLPLAHATNGYMPHAFTPIAKGMGGAGEAALPQDALSMVGNPAGPARVDRRLDVSASWFSPRRSYEGAGTGVVNTPMGPGFAFPVGGGANGTGEVNSEKNNFIIPSVGYVHPLTDKSAIGIALFANGGMNTTYSASDTTGGVGTMGGATPMFGDGNGDAGINLEQMGLSLGYAQDVSDTVSLGASALVGYQRFSAEGLGLFQNFGMVTPGEEGKLTDNGTDSAWGYGFQVGGLWDVNPMLTLGASYRTKTYMQKFDKYSGLFANGGEFDVPALGAIGAAIRPHDRLTIALDIQHIWFSDVDSVGNDNLLAQKCNQMMGGVDTSYCLGGSNGAGFGWKDTTVFKVGVQYEVDDRLTLRAGYSKGNQPIEESQLAFNVLAPAVIEEHWSIGGTYALNKRVDLGVWGMYSPEYSITGGGNPMTDASAFWSAGEAPTIKMRQYEVGVHFAWKFD